MSIMHAVKKKKLQLIVNANKVADVLGPFLTAVILAADIRK